MKIRTDFVTNSSSSSFTIQIKVKKNDGKVFGWKASANEEGGFYYSNLTALKSPAELAEASSTDELINMLNESVRGNYWDEDEPGESADAGDEMYGLENISMNDIKRIEITGSRFGSDSYCRTFIYDKETKEYYCTVYGSDHEINGGSGGDLIFDDEQEAKIHYLSDIHENMNYIENGRLYINARDNYGDFSDLFLGEEMLRLEFDQELEDFEEIVIGKNVEYIAPGILSMDGSTENYSKFIVSEENIHFCAIDGCLYSKDRRVLYQIPPKKVVDGLHIKYCETIESCAVSALEEIDGVTIFLDEGIKELLVQSILIPGKLTVYIPASVRRIDLDAFDGFDELEIIAPDNPYAQKRAEEIKAKHEK